MSRLEELKNQIQQQVKDQIIIVSEKIKETETYSQLSEKYQSLTSLQQKFVQVGAGALVVGLIFLTPLTQVQTSKEFIATFENQRQLIRDLFKTFREAPQAAPYNPAPASQNLIATINGYLNAARLIPEQILSVAPSEPEGRMIPQNLLQEVVEVKLSKLNLRQIVDIGSQLSQITETVKLKDMSVLAIPDMKGYFEVTYKLYTLKVPEFTIEAPEVEPANKKGKKNSSLNEDGMPIDE